MPNQKTEKKIVTRFAPSPTGFLHAGTYRTAIFSYLYARKNNGTFVLRIEDTDKGRSKKEFEDSILDSLKWLGLEYDVFVRQSENAGRHKTVLEKLIADNHAYISKEESKDGSGIVKEIVRFKNPNTDVTFIDEIKGSVTMNTTDLGDFVIAKNVNEPLFHLAVVVDDFDEGITHVIRGEDHVSNTPRHILIQRAIGAPTPVYAHLPLVLGTDRKKLSKRRGALALNEYRKLGYLPGAILNMVSLIGWNPGTDQEIFTRDELEKTFDLTKVQKAGAIFNQEKLEWINKEHIKLMDHSDCIDMIELFISDDIKKLPNYSRQLLEKISPIIIDRVSHFGEVKNMCEEGELNYFFTAPSYPKEKLLWKGESDVTKTNERLLCIRRLIEAIPDSPSFSPESVKNALWSYAEAEGRGNVLWPLRYALSGKDKSPDPFQLASLLGRDETLKRIDAALTQ